MKKRVLILSDSHGRDENVEPAMQAAGHFDLMIHLGDVGYGYERIKASTMAAVVIVAGNNDYFMDLPPAQAFEFGPHKILAVHGHRQNVHYGTDALERLALQNGCDIVMFGHTHVPYKKQDGDMLILNPGSISLPRQSGHRKTYMIMEMDDDGSLEVTLHELD
jgi:hypothetical protein